MVKFELVKTEIKKLYQSMFPYIGDTLLHTYLGNNKHLMICQKGEQYILYTNEMKKLITIKETNDIVNILNYVVENY